LQETFLQIGLCIEISEQIAREIKKTVKKGGIHFVHGIKEPVYKFVKNIVK
jgi:hypothetical protein